MIKILLNNVNCKIVGVLPSDIKDLIDQECSYKLNNAKYMQNVKNKKWDGVIHLFNSNYQSFSSGMLSSVTDILDQNDVEYTKIDERRKPEQNLPHLTFTPPKFYQERDYQKFTIDKAYSRTRGILKMATGSGKTSVATELISKIKTAPFIFYVLSKDLMKQAYNYFSSTLNEEIGMVGGGICDIKNINICTIQSAIRAINIDKKIKVSDYKFDEDDSWDEDDLLGIEKLQAIRSLILNAKGVMLDECHHVASKTAKEVLNASQNAYWKYGFSATPLREDGAEMLIQAIFGRKIVDINASYLIDNGFLLEPYIIFDPIIHENCSLHSYQSIYKNCIEENMAFHKHVANTANHLVSRQMSTLVLVKHFPQGDALKELIPGSDFITGDMTLKKREQALDDLRNRKRMCLIATSLADEGLDVPTLDAALLAGGGASSTRVHQRIGRTLRIDRTVENPRKKSIVVFYEHKGIRYFDKHTLKAKKIIKTEPRFRIVNSAGGEYVNSEIDSIMGFEDNKDALFGFNF
jgi:superfamily II DNA or RNA helicase